MTPYIHNIDPNVLTIGTLTISWYSLLFATSIFMTYYYIYRSCRRGELAISPTDLNKYLVVICLVGLIGARAVHVVIFDPSYYLAHPLEIFYYWRGGLAEHGGLLGIYLTVSYYAMKARQDKFAILDKILYPHALGVGLGRIGNFMNGELWGRVAASDYPFAVIFPKAGSEPRHPSQLYEAFGEGLLLFAILSVARRKWPKPGVVTISYFFAYPCIRFCIEYFREPDGEFDRLGGLFSTGQWLCIVTIFAAFALRRNWAGSIKNNYLMHRVLSST